MRANRSVFLMLRYAFCLAVGLLLGSAAIQFAAPGQSAAPRASIPYTMRERLGANLYMQTAAEYRACCLQTYHLAQLRLAALMAAKPAKPAIVMDLDETVLDNSAYESYLYESGKENSQDQWMAYERDYPDRVALVPGAKPFIEKAEAMGATVVDISNRSEQYRSSTIKALKHVGINVDGIEDRLHLRTDTPNKTQRREEVAANYNVLLFFGDNLRDFSEMFIAPTVRGEEGAEGYNKAIQSRFERVDEAAWHFGENWFILPNPAYGEWENLIGSDPLQRLRPSGMK
jgi:acid phosphatase